MAKKKQKKKQATPDFKGPIKLFWGLFLAGVLTVAAIFGSAALGLFGPMPPLQQLENPKTNLATQIISSDGEILGKFFYNDNRTPIGFDELPEHLVQALVATEDERFYAHSGIDFRGTLRAIAFLGSVAVRVPLHNNWHANSLWECVRATKHKRLPKKSKNGYWR